MPHLYFSKKALLPFLPFYLFSIIPFLIFPNFFNKSLSVGIFISIFFLQFYPYCFSEKKWKFRDGIFLGCLAACSMALILKGLSSAMVLGLSVLGISFWFDPLKIWKDLFVTVNKSKTFTYGSLGILGYIFIRCFFDPHWLEGMKFTLPWIELIISGSGLFYFSNKYEIKEKFNKENVFFIFFIVFFINRYFSFSVCNIPQKAYFALFLLFSFPFFIFFMEKDPKKAFFWGLVIVILGIQSTARTSLVAGLAGALIYGASKRSLKWATGCIVFLWMGGLIPLFLAMVGHSTVFLRYFFSEQTIHDFLLSFYERCVLWDALGQMQKSFWWGTGPGSVNHLLSVPLFYPFGGIIRSFIPRHGHNFFLQLWASFGAVGLFLVNLIFIPVMVHLRRSCTQKNQSFWMALMSVILVFFWTEYSLFQVWFWAWLGVVILWSNLLFPLSSFKNKLQWGAA